MRHYGNTFFKFFEETGSSESNSEFDDSELDDSEFDLEQKSGKSIGERLTVRKQKFNDLNELIAEIDSLNDMQADLYATKDKLK